jgi:hypothetical protein
MSVSHSSSSSEILDYDAIGFRATSHVCPPSNRPAGRTARYRLMAHPVTLRQLFVPVSEKDKLSRPERRNTQSGTISTARGKPESCRSAN